MALTVIMIRQKNALKLFLSFNINSLVKNSKADIVIEKAK